MKTTIKIVIVLLLLVGLHAQAQVRFTTKAPESVTIGETFTIRYTLSANAENAETSSIEMDGLDILFGPAISISSDMKKINGKETTEHSTTFSYTCQAKKRGKINISRLTVKTAGNSYQSDALQIQVLGDGKEQNEKSVNKSVGIGA